MLFDSWAGILPPSGFRRWVIGPTSQIVTALRQRHPGLPMLACDLHLHTGCLLFLWPTAKRPFRIRPMVLKNSVEAVSGRLI
jgi:hypothetical protein